ncbi:hypothetical protein DFH08DRAFT_712879 [Mycena albidolilacea]|uniref:Uncharacterized protein n=1 Tax=Mycena albidolilacea TaxID=1033008 RepID=A0AAD7EH95_9AGAR|nr:hypothetical protein DFH08DRAFT_712879 [Mycena albidolilacea]
MHPELAFGAFLASFLVLVPLPWHWRASNTTTLSMLAWLFVSNIVYAINATWGEADASHGRTRTFFFLTYINKEKKILFSMYCYSSPLNMQIRNLSTSLRWLVWDPVRAPRNAPRSHQDHRAMITGLDLSTFDSHCDDGAVTVLVAPNSHVRVQPHSVAPLYG